MREKGLSWAGKEGAFGGGEGPSWTEERRVFWCKRREGTFGSRDEKRGFSGLGREGAFWQRESW